MEKVNFGMPFPEILPLDGKFCLLNKEMHTNGGKSLRTEGDFYHSWGENIDDFWEIMHFFLPSVCYLFSRVDLQVSVLTEQKRQLK